jgi:GNAT superfamily N-acetyltransferase
MSEPGLPLGWHTELAVLRLAGSTIVEHADHVVVRTEANPRFYWGNFVLVTDSDAVDRAAHWHDVFEREFPTTEHRAIGLVAEPRDAAAWREIGLTLDGDDVLASASCPAPAPLPPGYHVKRLSEPVDWERSTGMRTAEFPDEADFERRTTELRVRMTERGDVAWFGAFHGDQLAAELGIVDCGEGVARYQSVVTATAHRRRGLAGHLLGVGAAWADQRSCRSWVIIADADSDASRLYQARGFEPVTKAARAYRTSRPG